MAITELLHSALEAHGVASSIEGGSVRLIGDAGLVLEPRMFDGPPNDHAKLIQLDIVAYSPRIAPRFIVESMAGIGSDRSTAEHDAFGKFLLGPFHVLLTALADHSCEANPAEWLKWGNGPACWRVCDGPLLIHGTGQKTTTYPEFVEQLQELFLDTASHDVHWVRVFVASFGRKLTGADVLLDNERWAEGAALLEKWNWAFPEEYRSLRHFFVALPAAGRS